MDEATRRLGTALQAAREGRRPKLTQPKAAELLGVSRTTVQNIEAGKFNKVNSTIREYATRLLNWDDQAVDRVMAGGSPEPPEEAVGSSAGPEVGVAPSPTGLGLSPAIEYELRTSETLDSAVINLGPDEDDGHVIVVLQGRKGATPEEVARIAARYRKARRVLQGLAADADDEVADS
ncbi:helix-turn-helix transcriptional regulator [Streptomyces cellulosae]|uniref:helix-turn-helix transcriptional regulator n=1 Tax=Streptomyces cellulosae TaxID=1968 RepID=UPI0004CC45EF|nr:helix-turn-helix transcriptional regulator [Streptomyces cellulosae]